MPLTFEDAGLGDQRRWQCFVCGKSHTTFEEYKEHIAATHEEGREYITCPDCSAPVRDMKMHYKAKHPQRAMPTGCQMRVAVWFDKKRTKDGKGKTTVRKGMNFRKGEFESKKCGRMFTYRSGLEEEFYNILEEDADVDNWFVEPMKIPYFWKGEWHDYIPDIRVNYIDGSTDLWEIKPANQTHYEQNKAKWVAANNYCSNVGWNFVVLTEVGLGKLKVKMKQQRAEKIDQLLAELGDPPSE